MISGSNGIHVLWETGKDLKIYGLGKRFESTCDEEEQRFPTSCLRNNSSAGRKEQKC